MQHQVIMKINFSSQIPPFRKGGKGNLEERINESNPSLVSLYPKGEVHERIIKR